MSKPRFSHDLALAMVKEGQMTERAFNDLKSTGVIGPSREETRVGLFEEELRPEVTAMMARASEINLLSKQAQLRVQVLKSTESEKE